MGPYSDRVLVSPIAPEKNKDLYISSEEKLKPTLAVVKEVGPQVSPDTKIGDKIQYGQHSGNSIKIDGVDYLLLREDELQYNFGIHEG